MTELYSDLEAEVPRGIPIGDIANEISQKLHIARHFTFNHIAHEEIAENPPEIFEIGRAHV